ncbi:hypothetical protein BU24DRAFT_423729 [Aaosphaeria arxii CBS 175.79]|uniref:Uncharacterized protein n=1 Tax=Aaosphaeria arxii CBS 175.79 TaxID=1450172 RepID=A0A6A5XR84_9PLEO|nr:uncharacterized protein BU24DRAFT_423729 [Aaosphaeria arxii CBS 175.79]KAF2014814.1 hypothetical protein BU24DRAFT_423729 [Aaosphaeria arxii CBS 175.79]
MSLSFLADGHPFSPLLPYPTNLIPLTTCQLPKHIVKQVIKLLSLTCLQHTANKHATTLLMSIKSYTTMDPAIHSKPSAHLRYGPDVSVASALIQLMLNDFTNIFTPTRPNMLNNPFSILNISSRKLQHPFKAPSSPSPTSISTPPIQPVQPSRYTTKRSTIEQTANHRRGDRDVHGNDPDHLSFSSSGPIGGVQCAVM